MREWLDIYKTMFKIDLAVEFQYPTAMFIWLLGGILEPVIYLLVWQAVALAQGGSVQGMTVHDFAAYFILGMLVNQATFSWIVWEYEYYIREGTLAMNLLRPIHPIHNDINANLSYKLLTLVVLLPAALLLAVLFQAAFAWSLWSILLFLPVLLLAFLLRFFLDWSVAMAAFWTTRTSAINQLYYLFFLFFSGKFAPLELFPSWVQRLADLLPFRWALAFPLELILGKLTMQAAVSGIAVQLLWLAIAFVILRSVWAAGLRKFSAVGS